jgi:SprT protein
MARLRDHDLELLGNYVPEGAAEEVLYFMHTYQIHLKIKRERRAILGDYRPAHGGKQHTISINGTLNPYHFLITFIHELAHLITYLNFNGRVAPHGAEWKSCFKTLLQRFVTGNIFPNDIKKALMESLEDMRASTCSDPELYKVLVRYNPDKGLVMVENLPPGAEFITDNEKRYRVLEKRRTRYVCVEIRTGRKYLFPGIAEVMPIE